MSSHGNARPTQAEIDLGVLECNFRSIKAFVGEGVRYMAVVKADAYGHCAVECSKRLEAAGVDWFGVAIPEEGIELRKAGIKSPILCLGSFWPGQEETLLAHSLTSIIYTERAARSLNTYALSRGQVVDIHVKIDTGMGRLGIRPDNVSQFAGLLKGLGNLRVTGLMTHFASAEDPRQNEFTTRQMVLFETACDEFRKAGHDPEWIDLANSPGAIGHPEAHGNMVRLGGGLYGLLDDIIPAETPKPAMKPVLSLRSRIADIRSIPAGETLGYGRTFETERDSRIALVPVGYADGYPRALSNRGKACVRGQFAPIAGRISMDWTLLDVTDVDGVAVDDDVVLIGSDGECSVSAAEIARYVDTIGYEITCGISRRVRRVFI